MPATKHTLSAFFTVAICMVMLAMFVTQAQIVFHRDAAPTFSMNMQIAYGYPPICGDGTKAVSEGCDDGNTTSGDGCNASCGVEFGYDCVGTTPSVCETTCGDGFKAPVEACDDANLSSGDGCSATCTIESGYMCSGSSPSSCSTTCGDGIMTGAEQCDESGETASCNADCTLASCGDGKTNMAAGEVCDNAGANGADKPCNLQCKKTYCGDGIIQTPNGDGQTEACEPSLNATCSNSCTVSVGIGAGITPASSASSSATRLAPPVTCGNGVVDVDKWEQCDDGRFNGISGRCDRWCQAQYCGDNIVEKENGEECEPTRGINGGYVIPQCGRVCTVPLCTSLGVCNGGCRWIFLAQCSVVSSGGSSSITRPILPIISSDPATSASASSASFTDIQTEIGNGILETTGPLAGAASSSSAASFLPVDTLPPFQTNIPVFPLSSAPSAQCGDGVVQAPEACDNGLFDSDTKPDACRVNCTKPQCGDAVVDSNEECDLGAQANQIANGCTPTCKISICGNSILEPGEECDEGKRNSASKPNSCSTLCLLPRCSDGILDTSFGEVCDNGTNDSNTQPDACRLNCVPAYCGDGVKDSAEQCDDGPKGSASCSAQCVSLVVAVESTVHPAATSASSFMAFLILAILLLFVGVASMAYRMNKLFR